MIKIGSFVASFLLIFVILGPPGIASGKQKTVEFRFNLGAAISGDGDIGILADGFENFSRDLAGVMGLRKSGEIGWTRWARSVGGEFTIGLSPRVRLGLGFGWMAKTKENRSELGPSPLIKGELDFDADVLPLTFSGYLFFPISDKCQVYIKGGPGYYWARFGYEIATIALGDEDRISGKARSGSLGFHGGLGAEYKISGRFALFAEAEGRYAKFTNWIGDEKHNDVEISSAAVWYTDQMYAAHSDLRQYYPFIAVGNDPPQSPLDKNVRRFAVDFSGLQIQAGVRIGFGK